MLPVETGSSMTINNARESAQGTETGAHECLHDLDFLIFVVERGLRF